MPTLTTNYSLQKPLVNDPTDEDLWGGELNDDLDDIDTLLRQGITIEAQASQTANFNVTASISVKYLYPCDASGGAFAATIPLAATAGDGATVYIKKTDSSANAVTLARSGSDTLDGETSLSLAMQNSAYGLVSDGVDKWYAVSIISETAISPRGSQVITSGSGNFTTPSDTISTTRFKFTLTGGGGAGGGGSSSAGSGGGAGSTAIYYATGLSASQTCAYSIGAAGTAGSGTGGDGGNSTLTVGATTITAPGGGGGSTGINSAGGEGGASCTNATLDILGGGGASPAVQGNAAFGGAGGSSFWGGGGKTTGAASSGAGSAGRAYGSGGSGAYGIFNGGAGKGGILLVEWD